MVTSPNNSAEARLQKLQASWSGNTRAAKNLQSQTSSGSQTSTNTSQPIPYINNPDGTPVKTNPTPTAETNVVNTNPTPSTPVNTNWQKPIGTQQTSAAGNLTTQADVASDNSIKADNNIVATWQSEATSQANLTTELGSMDSQQLATRIDNATANQKEAQAIQEKQIAQKNANELEYQKNVQADAEAETAALRVKQESENSANAAAAAELKAKNEAAEYELQTQNEIAQQQSNIAFAKLGLSFSWAAINTAQGIYTQWVYNLAKLKTTNAKNYADLNVKINAVQFEHTMAINKIISDAHDKEFTSKERLRDFIGKAQTNILNSKSDSQKQIQEAIDTYKKERQAREDKLYSDMNRANENILSATKDIQKTISAEEDNAKKKIDMLINNGQWNSLSRQQQIEIEARAWVPAWTTANTIVAKTTSALADWLKAMIGKTVNVPPQILAKMHTEVQRALALNIPMVTAIKMAIGKYSNQIPDIQAYHSSLNAKAAVDASKVNLNNATAEAKRTTANAAMIKAQKSTGWGWKGGWNTKLQKATFTVNWENVQGYFNPSTGKYADGNGNLITDKVTPYVKPTQKTSLISAILGWGTNPLQ